MEDKYAKLKGYLNSEGQLTQWASKKHRQKQLLMLAYIAEHFDAQKTYTELEVNAIINQWHTFGDHALLRRELKCAGIFKAKRITKSCCWLVRVGYIGRLNVRL